MQPLKAEQLSNAKWRVLAIPFGGPLKGKDTDGEFFSIKTDIKPHWFDKRPVLFHHGQDEVIKDADIGDADDLTLDEKEGWWVTTWLNRSGEYFSRINALLSAGKMFGSSATMGHLAEVDRKTGEILKWPYVEQTFTPTPANLFSRLTPAKATSHFTSAGIAVPEWFTADLPDLGHDLPSGGDDLAMALQEARKQAALALAKANTY